MGIVGNIELYLEIFKASEEFIQAALELDIEPPEKTRRVIKNEIGDFEQPEFEETDE